ncbi:Hypothetical Protein FCC1311_048032 [Hondaea fermentalgiana]|uniref:Uncharacterized protein n=1 Tax=Hondaea fermentalgiana TaxID=2315210 RepID=A0A2R5GJX6_9STRA|nr:Hypothetical Protein FCC1311_048032 [Hondaea fermentalgiana]|eukprot:GBG28581.1 Hypothetical Protein FCC1311_048032 [Hondaea fermentalgiana]
MATLRRAKYKTACESFDASEAAFGQCRTCGFSLADHLARLATRDDAEKGSEGEDEVAEEVPPPPPEEPAKPQACHNFTFAKDGFGMCECGFAMEEHRSEDRRSSFRRSMRNFAKRISRKLTKSSIESPAEPCEHFAIDLNSEQYGLCFCGFNKLEHDKIAAKRALEEERREEERRKREESSSHDPEASRKPSRPSSGF